MCLWFGVIVGIRYWGVIGSICGKMGRMGWMEVRSGLDKVSGMR